MSDLTSSVQHCFLQHCWKIEWISVHASVYIRFVVVASVLLHFIAFLLCACEFGNQVSGVLLIVPSERTLRMLLVGFGTWPNLEAEPRAADTDVYEDQTDVLEAA